MKHGGVENISVALASYEESQLTPAITAVEENLRKQGVLLTRVEVRAYP